MDPDWVLKAKNKANEVLRKYQVTTPIVNIFDIAQNEGLEVMMVDLPDKYSHVAGFLDKDSKTIFVNNADAPNRKTFTVAHELGHFLLGHEPKYLKVLLRTPSAITTIEEKEANCFAANVLVPDDKLREALDKLSFSKNDYIKLAQVFGVSSEVMKNRLRRLE